jgi:hypothetical protein
VNRRRVGAGEQPDFSGATCGGWPSSWAAPARNSRGADEPQQCSTIDDDDLAPDVDPRRRRPNARLNSSSGAGGRPHRPGRRPPDRARAVVGEGSGRRGPGGRSR